MPKLAGVLLIALFLMQGAAAQAPVLANTSFDSAIASAVAVFNQSLDQTALLYNGREYFRYPPGIEGHGYLGVNDWQPALITYNSLSFAQVPAMYDMVKDELVIRHYSGIKSIQLVKELVDRFSIAGHNYVRIGSDNGGVLTPGFYHLLYEGSSRVLARRTKSVAERVSAERIESRFVQKDRYFVWLNNRYTAVNSEGSLLSLFGNQRKAVQQLLRKNKLRFRKDPEQTLVKAIAFYDASKN